MNDEVEDTTIGAPQRRTGNKTLMIAKLKLSRRYPEGNGFVEDIDFTAIQQLVDGGLANSYVDGQGHTHVKGFGNFDNIDEVRTPVFDKDGNPLTTSFKVNDELVTRDRYARSSAPIKVSFNAE